MHRLCCVVAGVVLLSAGGCADNPTVPADDGPIQVSVVAASTEIVQSGQQIPIMATVLKAGGKPYPNFLLNFNVLEGGGRMFGGAELTNNKGEAKDIWTIGFGSCQYNTIAVRAVDGTTGAGTTYFTQTVATPGKISFYRRGDDGQAAVYVMNVDGSNLTRLASNLGHGSNTDWSPDGRRIVFGAPDGIYVMNEDGSNKSRIAGGDAWSNDGNWFAFSRVQSGGLADIFISRLDGSHLINLTNTPEYGEQNPDWSPDDRWIAFSSDRDGDVGNLGAVGDIYVTDGSTVTRLTYSGGSATNPAWSPDGSRIAFDRSPDETMGAHDIFVMNADGSNPVNLTHNGGGDTWPDWSPDGSRIVFNHAEGENPNHDIWVMNADGSNPVNLTNFPAAHEARAAWSRCVPF